MFKTVRKLIALLILLVLGFAFKDKILSYTHDVSTYSLCDTPVEYNLSYVDPKFNVDKSVVLKNIQTSAEIWNKAYGKDLFVYNPEAKLSISLIFDERQRLLIRLNEDRKEINEGVTDLELNQEQYDQKVKELNAKVEEINKEIAYWNKRGGAPKEEYERLTNEIKNINKEIKELNNAGQNLNQSATNLNNKISDLNSEVTNYNYLLQEKPEEGIYIPTENKIVIYFYDSQPRFIHTSAHELGHALGLGHVEDENAIMHSKTSENLNLTGADKELLTTFCRERSVFESLLELTKI